MAAATVERGGLWRSRWAAMGAALAVTFGGGGLIAVNAASSTPSWVITIEPIRILDTRTDIGLPGPFVSAVPQKLQVTGFIPTSRGTQQPVPAGATGVLLNVTVVQPSAKGFLSVRPGDASATTSTSSLNFNAGDIVPNSVQVGMPTAGANAGQIDITYDAYGQAGPTTEVLIDVVGYMVPGTSVTLAKTRWAQVSANGTGANVQAGVGAVSASRVATGVFNVRFDGSIEGCGWTATLNDVSVSQAAPGEIAVERRSDNVLIGSDLWVRTYSSAGSPTDPSPGDGFTVTVMCP